MMSHLLLFFRIRHLICPFSLSYLTAAACTFYQLRSPLFAVSQHQNSYLDIRHPLSPACKPLVRSALLLLGPEVYIRTATHASRLLSSTPQPLYDPLHWLETSSHRTFLCYIKLPHKNNTFQQLRQQLEPVFQAPRLHHIGLLHRQSSQQLTAGQLQVQSIYKCECLAFLTLHLHCTPHTASSLIDFSHGLSQIGFTSSSCRAPTAPSLCNASRRHHGSSCTCHFCFSNTSHTQAASSFYHLPPHITSSLLTLFCGHIAFPDAFALRNCTSDVVHVSSHLLF